MSKIWVVYRIDYYGGKEDQTILKAFREESGAEAYTRTLDKIDSRRIWRRFDFSSFDYVQVDLEDSIEDLGALS